MRMKPSTVPGLIAALVLPLFLNVVPGFCMEWPVTGNAIKNFGWNQSGRPLLGIAFSASAQANAEAPAVTAAENGELLFVNNGGSASRLPSPLGSWLALDHGDGIIGIYGRMARFEKGPPETAPAGTQLGEAGISGYSGDAGVYFSLFDRKERRWINPDMIAAPIQNQRAPSIISVRLRNDNGELVDLSGARTVSQGRYTILVEAAQVFQAQNRALAPFVIECLVNGAEAGTLSFETYSARDGVLSVYRNGLVPVRQIYAPWPAYELGAAGFPRGQVTLEVTTRSAAGNAQTAVFRFTVQ